MNYKILLLIVALAVVLFRVPALGLRTIHIDEGMGIRASELMLSGNYHYSPYNGHGPTLFVLGAIIRAVAGTNIIFFRMLTALFAILAILFLWFAYKKDLNSAGQIILILGLGFSSAFLFYGNYFIHEMLFILLTVLALVSAELWLKTKKSIWLAISVVFLALMFMTKETALFTYASWFLAAIITGVIYRKNLKIFDKLKPLKSILFALAGFFVGALVYFLLFGKKFDLFLAPFLWLKHRGLTMFIQPWHYFVSLLFLHEPFLLIFGCLLAIFFTLKKQWDCKKLFFFLWFIFILICYSTIPYKTPWLVPNIILPLGIFIAFGFSEIWKKENKILLISITVVLFAASFFCLISDNFLHPDRAQNYDYAFLQGQNGFNKFLAVLNGLSNENLQKPLALQIIGPGDELLYVITEKYNRTYEPFTPGLPVYINYFHSAEETKKKAGSNYVFLKFTYYVPGPEIDMFVRKDIWNFYKASQNYITPKAIWPDGTLRYD